LIEVTFTSVAYGVEPLVNGGKSLNLIDQQTGTIYRIPFIESAAADVAERFGMTNEQLTELVKGEQARRQLLQGVDGQPPPGVNGTSIDPTKRMPSD
jgi:hypothetical protein